MGIAFDASSVSANSTGATLTWNHTVGAGANRLLVVGIVAENGASQSAVTAVSYGGVAMTKAHYLQTGYSNLLEVSIWVLPAPASGTYEISATISNYLNTRGAAASYMGCLQTTTPNAVADRADFGNGLDTDVTFNIYPYTENTWIFAVVGAISTGGVGLVADQTSRSGGQISLASSGAYGNVEDTNGPRASGANSVGFTLYFSEEFFYGMAGIAFAPAPSSGRRRFSGLIDF